MKILAIDTATEACSAALYYDGEINQQYRVAPREHSHIILPMIDRLMAEAGLQRSAPIMSAKTLREPLRLSTVSNRGSLSSW